MPYQAGGATDKVARTLSEKLAPRLGQPVIVDNKGGAGGIIGVDAVAKAAPDGHTLTLALSSSLLINQFLFKKMPFNPQRDLAMVTQVAVAPLVLVAHPSVTATNTNELAKDLSVN